MMNINLLTMAENGALDEAILALEALGYSQRELNESEAETGRGRARYRRLYEKSTSAFIEKMSDVIKKRGLNDGGPCHIRGDNEF